MTWTMTEKELQEERRRFRERNGIEPEVSKGWKDGVMAGAVIVFIIGVILSFVIPNHVPMGTFWYVASWTIPVLLMLAYGIVLNIVMMFKKKD